MTVQAMKAELSSFWRSQSMTDALLSAIRHAIELSRAALGDEGKMQELCDSYTWEQEGMKLIVTSMLNKQVGLKLGISKITLKTHRGKN